MKTLTSLNIVILAGLSMGLCACGKSASMGLFAERSIPVIAPAASAETPPSFVGRWAASAGQCKTAIVIEARSLRDGRTTCDFAKVDASSAGYAVASTCTVPGGLSPGKIYVMMSEPNRPTTMTLSGGPYADPVALQRCPAG